MIDLLLTSALLAALLYIPGLLVLRAAQVPSAWALCCAPLLSLALIAGTGQAFALVGIASTPLVLAGAIAFVTVVVFALTHALHLPPLHLPTISWVAVGLSAAVGIALGYNLFLSRLTAPNALFQAYDITQHLNLIRAMADSGEFTSLGVSPYMTAADKAIAPVSYGSFYPAGWHSLCALAIMISRADVVTVINASMFVIPCIAFPLGMLALTTSVFGGEKRLQLLSALASLAFAAFPWLLITFGPVFPNVAGFSLMPSAMAFFVLLLAKDGSIRQRSLLAIGLIVSAIGLALCHPNTIFTCVVLLSPYCVSRICETCDDLGKHRLVKLFCCGAFVAFVLLVWNVCFRLSIFQDIVTHVWPPFARPWQKIVDIILLSPTFGFYSEIAAQFLLAALVIVGGVRILSTPGKRWLLVSYVLPCLILIVSSTREDSFKQLVAGFWYTDPMRIAAMCSIAAIPMAITGLSCAYDIVLRLVRAYNKPAGKPVRARLIAGSLVALFLIFNFMPEFNLPGMRYEPTPAEQEENEHKQYRDWTKGFHTTFGDYRRIVEDTFSYNAPLRDLETQFIHKAQGIVEPDALIINNPMDGSFLAYGANGLHLYYRNFLGFGGSRETPESELIRTSLRNYADNQDVQEAVKTVGARYVMVLLGDADEAGFINLRGDYKPELFEGITGITRDTPGFTFKYAIGPMALYEIDGTNE